MKRMKRVLALLLAALTVFALTACGERNVEETPTPEFTYAAHFDELPGGMNDGFYVSFTGPDGFYGFSSEKVGERELEEGEVLEYEGQLDIYAQRLYRLSLDGTLTRLDGYEPMEYVPEEGHSGGSNTNYLAPTSDGGFLALDAVYDSWSESGADPNTDPDTYYSDYNYLQTYYLRRLDNNGAELSRVKLDTEKLIEEMPDIYFYSMAVAGDKQVLLSGDGGLFLFDADSGKLMKKIGDLDWAQTLLTLKDGSVAVAYYGDSGSQIAKVDLEAGKLGESFHVTGDLYRMVAGKGEYDLYYSNGANFFGYKMDSGESYKLFNWINCDVDNDNITGFTVTEDGKVIAVSNEWDSKTQTAATSLVTVEQVPTDSLPKKEIITLATQYLDWNARSLVIDFNRRHDDIRIELLDYSEYNTDEDYGAGLTKLRTEMLAGNCPDIIDLNGLPFKQLAAKGLLADLYPLIDADPELNREDFFPTVLKAMEINGKLYSTCSSFDIISAVGASKVVGSEPGWTYGDLMAALEQMPEGCTVFSQSETRYDILQLCLMLDMDRFVNWNTGEVSFNSPEFIELLNFAKNFPAEFDWENYEWSESDNDYNRIMEGQQLLIYGDLYNFDSISQYENIFGGLDGFTFIGFPTHSGVGNMLSTSAGYAICDKCKNKEAAWEFVRTFMTEDYQENNIYSFPSNIHSYEAKKTNAMTPTYMKDDEGRIMLDPETGEKMMEEKGGYWDEKEQEWVPVYSYSQEEIDKIESIIRNTDRVYVVDEAMNEIVREQVEAFFAGQRSAEDVASLIQSKARIYVNEQR